MTILVSARRKLPSHHRVRFSFSFSQNKTEFSNQLPYFDINVFDDERNERIDGRFVPMTDSEVDNLIETAENANTKNKRLV